MIKWITLSRSTRIKEAKSARYSYLSRVSACMDVGEKGPSVKDKPEQSPDEGNPRHAGRQCIGRLCLEALYNRVNHEKQRKSRTKRRVGDATSCAYESGAYLIRGCSAPSRPTSDRPILPASRLFVGLFVLAIARASTDPDKTIMPSSCSDLSELHSAQPRGPFITCTVPSLPPSTSDHLS